MARITVQQLVFLAELKSLDDSQLGMVWPSANWSNARVDHVADQLIERGYVRAVLKSWGRAFYLRTRGLRALQRSRRRFQPGLPLGLSDNSCQEDEGKDAI